DRAPLRIPAGFRSLGIPGQVMADVEVEVAIVVEVGKCGRGRPVAVAPQAGRDRRVLEGPIAAAAIKRVGPPAGDDQFGIAVVGVVAHGSPVAVAARKACDAGTRPDVLEGAVAAVAEQAVAMGPSGWDPGRVPIGRELPALGAIDIEPAVAIII